LFRTSVKADLTIRNNS